AGEAVMSKYGNRKVEVDGITFHTAKEAERYVELKLLERAGEIFALNLQPRYPLVVNGVKVCTYVADFVYCIPADQGARPTRVVEDVKGYKTPEYKLKAKLFQALHGFPVVEI